MSSPLSVLTKNRDFRRLFAAELVVFGADWFVMVPLLVLLPELTGSAVWGGLVLAVDTGINAVMLPYTGTVADRIDRKKIMMAANLTALVGVLLLFGVRDAGSAWIALVAIGVVAVAKAFYSPAAQAALPNVVDPEDLATGYAVAGSAWGTMTVVGASLGGVLSAAAGPYACFWIAAVSLAVAAGLAALIRRPMQAPRDRTEPAQRTWAAMREALHYIVHRPRVLALVTVKSAVGLGNGVLTVFPVLAGLYGLGGIGTGLLFGARGAGALVGPILTRRVLTHLSWLLPGLALSMSSYGLAYIGASVVTSFPLVLVLVFVAHFAGGSNWVMSNYALQNEVPDRLRGRVFATDMMLATLAVSVSQLIVTTVVDRVEPWVVLAGGGLTTVVYAIAWRIATRKLTLAEPGDLHRGTPPPHRPPTVQPAPGAAPAPVAGTGTPDAEPDALAPAAFQVGPDRSDVSGPLDVETTR